MLRSHPRTLGVDVGTRRVGLAVADPLGLSASPLATFAPDEALREIHRIAETDGLARLVVGWPLTLDDQEGEAVDRVRPYVARLQKAFPETEVHLQDERYSSRRGVDAMVALGTRRSRRGKGFVDAAAAAIILQDFLDESREHP